MNTFTSLFNIISSLGTIVFLVGSVALLLRCITKKENAISRFVTAHTIAVIFFSSLIATIGSLVYSLIIGFPPCDLCWYQRIFMYPVVLIAGYDVIKKKTTG